MGNIIMQWYNTCIAVQSLFSHILPFGRVKTVAYSYGICFLTCSFLLYGFSLRHGLN